MKLLVLSFQTWYTPNIKMISFASDTSPLIAVSMPTQWKKSNFYTFNKYFHNIFKIVFIHDMTCHSKIAIWRLMGLIFLCFVLLIILLLILLYVMNQNEKAEESQTRFWCIFWNMCSRTIGNSRTQKKTNNSYLCRIFSIRA